MPVEKLGRGENPGGKLKNYHGRSWVSLLETEKTQGWNEILGSHTFHEIQMYYPMRVVRDQRYKLIWNIAHQLDYPFASDLWIASSWQAQFQKGQDTKYGKKTVRQYIRRDRFELYDLKNDPLEKINLVGIQKYEEIEKSLKQKLVNWQMETDDFLLKGYIPLPQNRNS